MRSPGPSSRIQWKVERGSGKIGFEVEMKKSALIVVAILAVIVIGAHYADKATRLPKTNAASLTKTESKDVSKDEPELTLKDLDGKDVSLASLKGKVVLVNF